MLSFAFIIGSLSPGALGWMAPRVGLANGLSSLAACYLFGAACLAVALKFFLRRDYIGAADPFLYKR